MPGVQIADAKAPFIMFERRPVEDREASITAGRYVAKDVDFVLITPHGSKDQIERVVSEWFEYLESQVREGRFDATWLKGYRRAFDDWREGKEVPLEGTPVINWPIVSPAQVKMLQDLHILTVEVLAGSNEEVIRRLGMGGRSLVQKAKDFLAASNGPGKVAEELNALKARLEAQDAQLKDLAEANAALRAKAGASSPATPTLGLTSDDILDAKIDSGMKRKL
jgi:hypothetical protein